MTRGDLVTVVVPGDFGKPRPALLVQADRFSDLATVTVLLVTSSEVQTPLFRIPVEPSSVNGLQKQSFIMADKAMTVRIEKLGPPFGRLEEGAMHAVNRAMALFLGIAS